jgi:hypothetical protein
MFFAEGAVLVQLQSVGGILFVFVIVIITLFAFGAGHSNFYSVAFCICHNIFPYFFSTKIYTRLGVLDYTNTVITDCQIKNNNCKKFLIKVFFVQ